MKKLLIAAVCLGMSQFMTGQTTKVNTPPIMGWSSWNTYQVNINEQLIMRQTDAMIEKGLAKVGYKYINIDDGFFGYRDEKGYLHTHPERFPNGLKEVVNYIHGFGLKAGIYSDAGTNTCGSIWSNDPNGVGAGLYGFEHQDADLFFNHYGFDFIKIDYCGAGQELNLEEEKRYRAIRSAIDEVAGPHVSINICRWAFPGTWAKEVGSSWRISLDIKADWHVIKYIVRKNRYLSAYAGDGHYNDMDMLEIGRGMPINEEEVHFGIWCIMSSPLLIGCDMSKLSDASLALLKNEELIALNQDPLGLQAYIAQNEGDTYVFVKDILKKRGLTRAVALYNPADEARDFEVPLSSLELAGKVKVRDLIHHKDLGVAKDHLSYQLPAHSVKILRLEAEKRLEPTLYEAEWAYMPKFNDLEKAEKVPAYKTDSLASGQAKVVYVGGERDNYLEWKEVFSETGGSYEMTVRYMPEAYRTLEINVNRDKTIRLDKMDVQEKNSWKEFKTDIVLKPGYNVIRMGSPIHWAPEIDCFTLKKKE